MSGAPSALWTAEAADAATGGRSTAAWSAGGVSIDSRTLAPGDLFVAIAGPNFDGHEFIDHAFAQGAAAAMVSRPGLAAAPGRPLLQVGDTLAALADLGRAARARSSARVIGVTGSVGKTGVKEALRAVLGALGPVHANEGSLNNHWGLPLSLARLPQDARYAVFEMGMNHPGEIRPLTRMACPHVAVITTVEAVHRAFFASVEAIADAKAEIFEGVVEGGVAVLNRDNPHFARLAAGAGAAGVATVVPFGRHADAGVRLLDAAGEGAGSRVTASVAGERLTWHVPAAGAHWVQNSLCVMAAAVSAGADAQAVADAFARFRLPKGRGRRSTVDLGAGPAVLIDDSYNASPVSMAAAFAVLAEAVPGPGGRRIAVIGDMLELGEDAAVLHRDLAGPLAEHGVDKVFCSGPMMAHLFAALPAAMRGAHAADSDALIPAVLADLRGGDVVVVKGSAGSRMGRIVQALHDRANPAAPLPPTAVNGR